MLRVLSESYASEIARLEQLCLGEQAWSENSVRQEFSNTFSTYCAYCIQDKVVGTVGVRVIDEFAEINNVAVHPDYRRQGIAFSLMKWVETHCRELGATVVSLEVEVDNIAAQQLYLKCGYKVTALRKNFYTHNQHHSDAYTMQLVL